MRVGVNSAIGEFGISGTARVTAYIHEAFDAAADLEPIDLRPRISPHGRWLSRALSYTYWDLWAASRSEPIDVFVSPSNIGRAPRDLPHVLWMQDTMALDHPDWFDRRFSLYARALFGTSARSCTRLVTASEDAARNIRARWPRVARVDVIPWPAVIRAKGPRSLPGSPRTVLMVGGTLFHKNHGASIEAVRRLRDESGEDLRLTIVGPQRDAEPEVRRRMREADPGGSWIVRRVDVPQSVLEELYAGAWVLAHPALGEGFGLPVLEAASHALPVVHSGRGPLPEVVSCGNVRSVEPDALAAGLRRLLDPVVYAEASATVLADAERHGLDDFRDRVAAVVRDAAR
jgi:alpha-1,3-rhamnosyl/mannosyltransferase